MSVVAAPVLLEGRMVAALAVAAPATRMAALGKASVAERAIAAARRVAQRLAGAS